MQRLIPQTFTERFCACALIQQRHLPAEVMQILLLRRKKLLIVRIGDRGNGLTGKRTGIQIDIYRCLLIDQIKNHCADAEHGDQARDQCS